MARLNGTQKYLLAVKATVISLDGEELLSTNCEAVLHGVVAVAKSRSNALDFLGSDLYSSLATGFPENIRPAGGRPNERWTGSTVPRNQRMKPQRQRSQG